MQPPPTRRHTPEKGGQLTRGRRAGQAELECEDLRAALAGAEEGCRALEEDNEGLKEVVMKLEESIEQGEVVAVACFGERGTGKHREQGIGVTELVA